MNASDGIISPQRQFFVVDYFGGESLKTVIMAGGKGTRISELFPDIPKPLIPIKAADGTEKPVLEWEIESLRCLPFIELTLNQVGSQHMGYACKSANIRSF